MKSHTVAFLVGVALTSLVAILLTSGDDAPTPHRTGPQDTAARTPVGAATEAPPPPESQPPISPEPTPSASPATPTATDKQIEAAIGSVRARFPIEDGILRHRVERSTRIALASYRTTLTLTPDQATRMAELLWPKLRRDFEATGEISTALARVKKAKPDVVRREKVGEWDNELDIYRRYDADLDRLLDEGPRRYREFALSVRDLLTADQRKILDEKEKLVVR